MSGVKFAIIVMSALIVMGLGLLGYGLATKIGGGAAAVAGINAGAGFKTEIALPPGAVIVGATALGDTFALHVRNGTSPAETREWFVFIEPKSGRTMGELNVTHTLQSPAAPEYP